MEIEIKVKVENIVPLINFLKANAKRLFSKRQIDEYYTPAHRDFLKAEPIEEWLRLRDSDGAYSINYKKWHYEGKTTSNYCDEYETPVTDIEALRKILIALDFKALITVDKQRESWQYEDYEISIDSVKDLGQYVEIEYTRESGDPHIITTDMFAFLNDLDCGLIERDFKGYPYGLLEKYSNK